MINFELPEHLIAQYPARPRDSARLLVYNRKDKSIKDTIFRDINKFLVEKSTLVVNNSKVENCRWLFNENRIEIFVLDKLDQYTVQAMVRPGRKFKTGQQFKLDESLVIDVVGVDEDGIRTLKLNIKHDSPLLKKYEHIPLPPYIKQNDELASEYQTVYAKPEGSKAAPTAGLHFTEDLMKSVKLHHPVAEVTLHVGLGTFSPLTETQLKKGKLHKEHFTINKNNMRLIKEARHITAVGTTTVRTLESIESMGLRSIASATDILIQPGYKFKYIDSLITNFHLPGTSLLLLVEAFVGSKDELQRIYNHAIENGYRFYSFGDAMLII